MESWLRYPLRRRTGCGRGRRVEHARGGDRQQTSASFPAKGRGFRRGAGGQAAKKIAKWDGAGWSALGSGTGGTVNALAAFDDGSGTGPALYAGGAFVLGPNGDSHLAVWGCPAIDTVPGCLGNPAVLASLSSAAVIGETLSLSLSTTAIASGIAALYLGGVGGTDAEGCGILAPSIGELLLGSSVLLMGSGPLGGGTLGFDLPVPADPFFVGFEVVFQGVALGLFDPGPPIELSNGLRVTITQ